MDTSIRATLDFVIKLGDKPSFLKCLESINVDSFYLVTM